MRMRMRMRMEGSEPKHNDTLVLRLAFVGTSFTPGLVECTTPSPPTKRMDFRGSDSSKLLILRGGNYHIHRI